MTHGSWTHSEDRELFGFGKLQDFGSYSQPPFDGGTVTTVGYGIIAASERLECPSSGLRPQKIPNMASP
jgi:hypothetical protein